MYVLKELQPTLFGTKTYVNDYFLLVNFPKQIADDVTGYKRELYHEVGFYDADNSIPHISLLRFKCVSDFEDKLLRELRSFVGAYGKIPLILKDFNHFDSSRTLYLDISDKDRLLEFHSMLRLSLKLNIKGIRIRKNTFNPHVTIGKNLSQVQFKSAVETFAIKSCKKHFLCNHLTLLRRVYDYRNDKEYWMKVEDIPLYYTSKQNEERFKEKNIVYQAFQQRSSHYQISFSVQGETVSDYLPELR